jgi:hypothetical protein
MNKLLTGKKQISIELFANIAINFLDNGFLQSRGIWAYFTTKKRTLNPSEKQSAFKEKYNVFAQ